jgi:hypothetical protein
MNVGGRPYQKSQEFFSFRREKQGVDYEAWYHAYRWNYAMEGLLIKSISEKELITWQS